MRFQRRLERQRGEDGQHREEREVIAAEVAQHPVGPGGQQRVGERHAEQPEGGEQPAVARGAEPAGKSGHAAGGEQRRPRLRPEEEGEHVGEVPQVGQQVPHLAAPLGRVGGGQYGTARPSVE